MSAIRLKSAEQIEGIRRSSKILVETFFEIRNLIGPGVQTREIDRAVEQAIVARGAKPAFKGFNGFPASACISVNEQVVHGIPGKRVLREGDIVGVDIGVNLNGYFSDAAFTFAVGEIDEDVQKLLDVTRESLHRGIRQAIAGNRISDISHAIQSYVEAHGFSVVRELVGHGVGLDVWEPPQIPNYGKPGKGTKIQSGMVLALEPMVNMGDFDVEVEDDGWTVVTQDGSLSAHFEHTIAVLDHTTEILTEGIESLVP